MGTSIHSRIIPSPALDYHAFCQCANQNSGNFYDFIPQPSNRLIVSLGDLPLLGDLQAITTPCLQSLVRGLTAGSRGDLAGLARELNGTLYLLGPHELCIPWFYASIDPIRHELQYVNAGHESPFLIRQRSGTVQRLERTGTALAFSAHSIHRQQTTGIDPGDLLVMFSEGVAESLAISRLLEVILENPRAGAAELTRRVFEEADRATDRTWPAEDLTFAAIRVVGACRQPILEEASVDDLLVCAA